MAGNNNRVNQELQNRQMEAKDSNIFTLKVCLIALAVNCLLWTNPWISWEGLVGFISFVSNGGLKQGAAILFYGLGLLAIAIPLGFGWSALKQVSASGVKP